MKTQATKSPISEKKRNRLLFWTASGIFLAFTLLLTIGMNPDYLWKLQDLDLFVYDATYFLDALQKVGGLSMYAGSFMYQFFYYPALGALLLSASLIFLAFLTARTFRLKGWNIFLAFIPSLALLLATTELGYMIYFQKMDGYVWDMILDTTFMTVGLWAYRRIGKHVFRGLYSFLFILIFYPIGGAFALFGGILMILISLKEFTESKQKEDFIPTLILLSSILLIPLFYYWFVYVQLAYSDIYLANLPYFKTSPEERMLWIPFVVLLVFYIVITFWKLTPTNLLKKGLPGFLAICCMTLVYARSFKDANFITETSMLRAIDDEDWNLVLKIAKKHQGEPDRLIVMSTNLALYKLGLASDKMFHYQNGDKRMNSPRLIVPAHMAGTLFYYEYGVLNYCNKWCMEGMVEYGLTNSTLKYFALSSLLEGEYSLTRKYNDILKSTLFHRSWALKIEQQLKNPESIATMPKYQNVLSLTSFNDVLDGDHYNLEAFLRNHFSRMREVPAELNELSVIYCLDLKNNQLFWPRLFRWVHLNPQKRIPAHFQEAALLFANLQQNMDLSGAPFDPEIINNFNAFMSLVQQYKGYSEESMRGIFHQQFGNTFWYYYFFVNDSMAQNGNDKTYQNK